MPHKAQKAPPLPVGMVLKDSSGREWSLGKPLASGGCGIIYTGSPVTGTQDVVVKIEPKGNGPLYTEMFCYQEAAQTKQIASWRRSNKLAHLGIPALEGSGTCESGGVTYRFLIIQRLGGSIWDKFLQSGRRFSQQRVFDLALPIIDALEYLHSQNYVHADIKSANLLLGCSEQDQDKVYLVDFGLAHKYKPNGEHREYKEDPRKGHNGTPEFTSIDAHKGVAPSRRGDMQILCYVMLQWLCVKLPWEDKLTDLTYVMNQKIKFSTDIDGLLRACFAGTSYPDEIKEFLQKAFKLGYEEKPNYDTLRDICKRVTGGTKKSAASTLTASPSTPLGGVNTGASASAGKAPGAAASSLNSTKKNNTGTGTKGFTRSCSAPCASPAKHPQTLGKYGRSSSSDATSSGCHGDAATSSPLAGSPRDSPARDKGGKVCTPPGRTGAKAGSRSRVQPTTAGTPKEHPPAGRTGKKEGHLSKTTASPSAAVAGRAAAAPVTTAKKCSSASTSPDSGNTPQRAAGRGTSPLKAAGRKNAAAKTTPKTSSAANLQGNGHRNTQRLTPQMRDVQERLQQHAKNGKSQGK